MPKRVPTASVIVIREDEKGKGRRVEPKIGKSFDFTDDEIAFINTAQPGALRKAVNETADDQGAHTSDDSKAGKESSSQSAPAGSKKATAAKGTKAKAKTEAIERQETGGGGTDAADDDDTDENEDETGGDDADEDEDI